MSLKNTFKIALSFVGLLVGAGFATGQEVIQYFGSFGPSALWGAVLAGVLMTILACYGLPEAPMAHWQMDPGYGFKLRVTPSLWMRANKIEVADTAPVPTRESES